MLSRSTFRPCTRRVTLSLLLALTSPSLTHSFVETFRSKPFTSIASRHHHHVQPRAERTAAPHHRCEYLCVRRPAQTAPLLPRQMGTPLRRCTTRRHCCSLCVRRHATTMWRPSCTRRTTCCRSVIHPHQKHSRHTTWGVSPAANNTAGADACITGRWPREVPRQPRSAHTMGADI